MIISNEIVVINESFHKLSLILVTFLKGHNDAKNSHTTNVATLNFLFTYKAILSFPVALGFPAGSDGKESACNAVDLGLIRGWGRSPGEGNGYPLPLYSCLENSMDREAWQAMVHGVAKSQTQMSNEYFHFILFSLHPGCSPQTPMSWANP